MMNSLTCKSLLWVLFATYSRLSYFFSFIDFALCILGAVRASEITLLITKPQLRI